MDKLDFFRDVAYDDIMDSVLQEARTYNTSTLITYSGYALAGLAVALTVALIIFYIIGIGSGRRRVYDDYYDDYYARSFNYNGGPSYETVANLLSIIEKLEEAFSLYGLQGKNQKNCQQRIICEAFLPNAITVNPSAADLFKTIFKNKVKVDKKNDSNDDITRWVSLRTAATDGQDDAKGCAKYIENCGHLSLEKLSQL